MSVFQNVLPIASADCHVHANAMATNADRVAYAAEDGIKLPTKYIRADGSCPDWSKSSETSHEVYSECSDLLCKPQRIYKTTYSCLIEAAQLGCVYVDILSSCMNKPGNFATNAQATLDAMEDAHEATGIESGLAITFKRHHRTGIEGAKFVLRQMLDFKNKGLDTHDRMNGTHMAGDEKDQSPVAFLPVYEMIAKEFGSINNGIHAGELLPSTDIWNALSLPGVTRIGHGLSAAEDPDLMAYLKRNNILIERTPTSNEKLLKCTPEDYPIHTLITHGIAYGLGTDDPKLMDIEESRKVDPKISGLTIADEYSNAHHRYRLTAKQLVEATLNTVRHGFSSPDNLQKVMDGLAAKYHTEFPLSAFHITRDPIVPQRENRIPAAGGLQPQPAFGD